MSTTVTYRGWIAEHSAGEAEDILYLSNVADPLAEEIKYDISRHGNRLSVRYFIADRDMSIQDLTEELIRTISGAGEATFSHAYSEITGYLWTDEDLIVGGHDLLAELRSHVGEFCHLEISYSA